MGGVLAKGAGPQLPLRHSEVSDMGVMMAYLPPQQRLEGFGFSIFS
jgi:hypothetical protein